MLEPGDFSRLAATSILRGVSPSIKRGRKIGMRKFKAHFGTSNFICAIMWNMMTDLGLLDDHPQLKPDHLLWTLHFFKSYAVEEVNATFFQKTEKTYRTYVWLVVPIIAALAPHAVSKMTIDVSTVTVDPMFTN